MDLGGRVVNVASSTIEHFVHNADIDRTPNETLAIMEKLREIEQEYNMTFEFEPTGSGGTVVSLLQLARAVGDTPLDIVNMGTAHTALDGIFTQNVVMDMNNPLIKDIIDLEGNPWAPETRMTNMFGQQFGVSFVVANSGGLIQGCITFNKDFMYTYNLPNLYEMVWNKTWDFGSFESILNTVFTASNGLVRPLVAQRESFIAPYFIMSNGGVVTEATADGQKLFVAHENEYALDAMTFLGRLVENRLLTIDVDNAIPWTAMGEAMFISGMYENLRRFTRQDPPTEYSFGLLPIPRGDHMPDFVTSTRASDMWYVVNDIQRPDEIAAIIVALANRISKINIIATELDYGVQDMESARVLEMMLEPERWVMDYSRLSSARNRVTDAINMVFRGEAAPRQAFEQFAAGIQQNYDSLMAQQN
jgi:hypothetical protein